VSNLSRTYSSGAAYDREYAGYTPDVPFLTELCSEYAVGGKVLNLCCGTLREGIPLARVGAERGFTLVGVDITPSMLDEGRTKLGQETESVRRVMKLVLGDIRNVDVGIGEFDFVFVPFNSFLHLMTADEQLAALHNIHRHLKDGGHFLADIFNPNLGRLEEELKRSVLLEDKSVADQQRGEWFVRDTAARYDPATQVVRVNLYFNVYDLEDGKQLTPGWWNPLELRVIFPGEWELLLSQTGFRITQKWGDYQRTPFNQRPDKMLFLCQKS
jgi:SAM-dependent methyltransferase